MVGSSPVRLQKTRKLLKVVGAIALAWAGANAYVLGSVRRCRFELVDAPPREFAIVPGAGVWGTEPSPVLEDRLRCAEDLLDSGRVQRILVTGDHGTPSYDETGVMARWLVSRGVPEEKIALDHAGFRTLDSMHRAHDVFGVQSAVVCTQRVFEARAVYLARSFGIDAVGAAADRRRYLGAPWALVRESIGRPIALAERLVGHGARTTR